MPGPKLNRKMLRAVGLELARGAPVSTFEDRIARRYRVTDRAVRKYAALVNAERDKEDAQDLKRARRQGRFVAMAAASRHLARADRLYADAGKLIARAARIDGSKGAAARLIAAIEAAGRKVLDDGPGPELDAEEAERELTRAPLLLGIARDDRRDAALLIKRAEQADARAADWFEKAQKISGTYEPEPETYDPSKHGGPAANLTSAQKRARLQRVLEAARAIAAKRKVGAERPAGDVDA